MTKLLLFSAATIVVAVFVVKAFAKLIEEFYNLRALNQDSTERDSSKRQQGMVYNTETGELEADQKFITPF